MEARPQPQPLAALRTGETLSFPVVGAAKADAAPVRHDAGGVYAVWTPKTPGLDQGKTRLLLAEDVWKTPLQWVARPTGGQGLVWLRAQATPPAGTAWPDGAAEFFMDGQRVGSGLFQPRGATTELFFGPDPRVSLRVTADSRGRGESGFVGKTRTWTWAWTYEIINARKQAAAVRLERPLPEIVDKDVRLNTKNTPQAKEEPLNTGWSGSWKPLPGASHSAARTDPERPGGYTPRAGGPVGDVHEGAGGRGGGPGARSSGPLRRGLPLSPLPQPAGAPWRRPLPRRRC